MKKQLIHGLLVIFVLATGGMAQKNPALEQQNNECLSDIKKQMLSEAIKFKIELDQSAAAVSVTENLRIGFIPILQSRNPGPEDFKKGVSMGLLFINSEKKLRVPNGYYKIIVSENQKGIPGKEASGYTASLFDRTGRLQAELPVKTRPNGNEVSYITPTVGICAPSMYVCFTFPPFTARWHLLAWLELGGL